MKIASFLVATFTATMVNNAYGATKVDNRVNVENPNCELRSDIVIMFDSSGSMSAVSSKEEVKNNIYEVLDIGQKNFGLMKQFAESLINEFKVEERFIHVGLTRFGTDYDHVQDLGPSSFDKGKILSELENMKYTDVKAKTYLGTALHSVEESIFNSVDRARSKDEIKDVSKTIIIITDGRANDPTDKKGYHSVSTVAPRLYDKQFGGDYTIFAVSIGANADDEYLKALTGDMDKVLKVDDFNVLKAGMQKIKSLVCDLDCVPDNWSEWGACDAQCLDPSKETESFRKGTRNRTRETLWPGTENGKKCELTNEGPCAVQCAIDCVQDKWVKSECDAVCPNGGGQGNGTYSSRRETTTFPKNGGKKCGPSVTTTHCTKTCPINCKMDYWKKGPCSASCDDAGTDGVVKGNITSTRGVAIEPQFYGKECEDTEKTETCEIQCGVDCQLGDWYREAPCNADCAGAVVNGVAKGYIITKRDVYVQPDFGGELCGATGHIESCSKQCAIDCEVGEYEEKECNAVCDGENAEARGQILKHREILVNNKYGGEKCPELDDEDDCKIDCKVDCLVGEWVNSTDVCENTSCRNSTKGESTEGFQSQTRVILRQPMNGGKECPELEQTIPCHKNDCPICKFAFKKECNCDKEFLKAFEATGNDVRSSMILKQVIVTEHTITCEPISGIQLDEECICPKAL
eukprot:Pgem_evm1s17176